MTPATKLPSTKSALCVALNALVLLALSGACLAQTVPAALTVPPITSDLQCSSVLLECNAPTLPAAHDTQLLDPATARDQAHRAAMQASQAQAEQSLQKRIEFAREHPNAIFVFGDKQQSPQESVRDQFARSLANSPSTLSSSTFDARGSRTECVNACYGPFCCVTTPAASDSLK